MVAARHDPVSSVRDGAIAAARAFDALEKQCPNTAPPALLDSLLHQVPSYSSDIRRSQRHKSRPSGDDTGDCSRASAISSTETLPLNIPPQEAEEGDQGAAAFEENTGDEAAGPETEAASHQAEEAPASEAPPSEAEVPSTEGDSSVAALADMLTAKRPAVRARRAQREPILRVSPSKAKKNPQRAPFSPSFEPLADDAPERLDESSDEIVTCAQAALAAAKCGESEFALRLCLVEDDLALLRQTLSLIGMPCLASLSRASKNAVCVALLTLLDDDEGSQSDAWLALEWLESLVDSNRISTNELDPRIRQALAEKLSEMSYEPTRLALGAARVLERLRLS